MDNVIRSVTSRVRESLVEVAYPSTCANCGQRGVWVCDICFADYTPLLPGLCCDRCGHPFILGRCGCRSMHPAIVRARAMSAYDGWVAKAVRGLKYHRERDRAPFLAEKMLPSFAGLDRVDAIIPVPLHPERYAWRGFNQAELLAAHIGNELGLPVEFALQRIRNTGTQTDSSRDDRLANMQKAFAVNPGWTLQPKAHYVLVDDVYTTGATIGACAEVLEAVGARLISVVTIAFDLLPRELELYKHEVSAVAP